MVESKTIELLGIPFDTLGPEEVSKRIEASARTRSKLWISTANLDWVMMAQSDPGFREHLVASDIVTCDGAPVMHLSRIAGKPLPYRITGVEIFRRLREGEAGPLRVGFFGAEDDEAQRASKALDHDSSPLSGAGGVNPGHGTVEALSTDEHIGAVNEMNADLLILALGAKKGQAWIARNHARLNVPVVSHLGAVVRHVSGDTIKAHPTLSKIGFEWAHRAVVEPELRSRYISNFRALPGLMVKAARQRRQG